MDKDRFLARSALPAWFAALRQAGFQLLGPRLAQGAIVYQPLDSAADLPAGWVDHQAPGQYRLEHEEHDRCFDWVGSAQGIKPWLFTAEQPLWTCRSDDAGLHFEPVTTKPPPTLVIGLRACDLAALALQDRHFLDGAHADPHYRARRAQLWVVAVNCHRSADTCFCVSTGDGPEVRAGADLILDELDEGFLVRVGSQRAARLLKGLDLQPLSEAQHQRILALRREATHQQRALPSTDLRAPLYAAQRQEALWQPVAERCLTCGNCTAVCPTCFCFRIDDEAALDGQLDSRVRRWDSCFSDEHSQLAGKVIRQSAPHKYRQWLTHKLATWHEQYGRSGCVGCGRCISWCPVGIDLVAEARRLGEEADKDA